MKNNLFYYATSELSQDAFICWLCSFALQDVNSDAILKECAQNLITLFVPECKSEESVLISIERQVEHIDILLTVECGCQKYKIIIEDKTYTKEHHNQLKNYFDAIKKKYSEYIVRGVYYKTGFQSDLSVVRDAEFNIVMREQMLEFMRPYVSRTTNRIFLDYYEYWNDFQNKVDKYEFLPISQWEWRQVYGFYDFLKKQNDVMLKNIWTGYGYVANQSGGFYGLWTGMNDYKIILNNNWYELYLQIETFTNESSYMQICLKLCSTEKTETSVLKKDRDDFIFDDNWKYKLEKYNFVKPQRLSVGKHMTIGIYNADINDLSSALSAIDCAIEDYSKLSYNVINIHKKNSFNTESR